MPKVAVTKRDAEKVLAAVKRQFKPWIAAGFEGPVLVKDFDWSGNGNVAPYAIVWESGSPYEWALMAKWGGREEEFGYQVPAAEFPDSVFTEPILSFILGIYAGWS